MSVNIIVCYNKKRGIGKEGGIPWFSRDDLKHFKNITMDNIVIMGRKTWDSMSKKFPEGLPGRTNIVVTRNRDIIVPDTVITIFNIEILNEFIVNSKKKGKKLFIIGGEELYKIYIGQCDNLYVTEINNSIECDTFFPLIPQRYKLKESQSVFESGESSLILTYYTYENSSKMSEYQYLDILKRILQFGQETIDRTSVGTLSLFGEKMRFDISETIPVLTTKRVAWKTVIKELLWMLKGQTDNSILQEQGVHIWDGNSSREYLDSVGLFQYKQGDLAEVYGFQWRHWGAEYKGCQKDYTNQGIDQIQCLINGIKENPHGRRHILTAWNVGRLHNMALPPCHLLCQFYVNKQTNTLSCQLYQRSGDMFLGIPFNIMSYSVLTYIIANITGYKPGEMIHIIGDAHIYNNHKTQVETQLNRVPLAFPKLEISRKFTNVDDITLDDFKLVGYTSHGTIKADMAV